MTRDCSLCGDPFTPVPFGREKCQHCAKFDMDPTGGERAITQDVMGLLRRAKSKWPHRPVLGIMVEAVDHVYTREKKIEPGILELVDVPDKEMCDILTEYLVAHHA